jgi:hypothetical protein
VLRGVCTILETTTLGLLGMNSMGHTTKRGRACDQSPLSIFGFVADRILIHNLKRLLIAWLNSGSIRGFFEILSDIEKKASRIKEVDV